MPVIQSSPNRLVLKSGSTMLALDKSVGQVTLQRKLMIWRRKPLERSLSQITNVRADSAVDRASGVEIWTTALTFNTGEGWAFPSANKQEAEDNIAVIREFLSLS